MFIPDCQLRPGVPMEHLKWAALALVEYKPDVIVVAGDFWDMGSLSSYEKPGSKHTEGARILEDVAVGNEGFRMLIAPMEREIERLKRNKEKQWKPERHITWGNHEARIDRAVTNEPKLEGVISREMLLTPGFQRHEYLEILPIDGLWYSHFYSAQHSGRPIGGSIDNMLNKIGNSFVQGHVQGFKYGTRQFPGKVRKHGLVAGSFYQHEEHYRDAQCQDDWKGIIVLNEVQDGDFAIMPLTLEYLRKKFG